jgi:hypothetical protein
MANILSLHNVSHRCRVEFDSKNGDSFMVTNEENGNVNVFKASDQGLYYYDINAAADNDTTVLVNTDVKDNKTIGLSTLKLQKLSMLEPCSVDLDM